MRTLFSRNFGTIALCCLIVCGCGSKPTEGATQAQSPTSAAAKKASDGPRESGDASADGGSPWGCESYSGAAVDYQLGSAAYLFIGDHPFCTDKSKLQEFCKTLSTEDGYVLVEHDSAVAESVRETAKSLPEESREAWLSQHPMHSLERAMVACGLKLEKVRDQLIAKGEASANAGKADGVQFMINHAPAIAEAIWKRECAGRMAQKSVGEGLDWDYKGNPTYKGFCEGTSDSSGRPPTFKGPAKD